MQLPSGHGSSYRALSQAEKRPLPVRADMSPCLQALIAAALLLACSALALEVAHLHKSRAWRLHPTGALQGRVWVGHGGNVPAAHSHRNRKLDLLDGLPARPAANGRDCAEAESQWEEAASRDRAVVELTTVPLPDASQAWDGPVEGLQFPYTIDPVASRLFFVPPDLGVDGEEQEEGGGTRSRGPDTGAVAAVLADPDAAGANMLESQKRCGDGESQNLEGEEPFLVEAQSFGLADAAGGRSAGCDPAPGYGCADSHEEEGVSTTSGVCSEGVKEEQCDGLYRSSQSESTSCLWQTQL